jgi:DNA (cytosine-5)-methyltransferase 1
MIELFSGIGAQERALRQLKIPYKIINTCDCDKDAVLSYAAMRFDIDSAMKTYQFSTQDKMIEELQNKGFGYDFMKGKHTITSRTPINKLKQYYIADKLSNNLGDISKVDRLPYADMVTYSFPCTDLSVAGKGEGMVNKCSCGYSWPIDFSNDSESLICPNCGAKVQSSTRSGLLGQVQRLLVVSKKENTLPKYLLLENVKNLVGKKFKPQFDAWIRWLDSIGYNTYYQVLNSKHFGIPQNRERIFALSIRKDVDNGKFKFPEQIPLTTRLKDILEKTVDEKYYLSGDKVESILANFIARQNEASGINLKDQATTFDGLTDVAHTLMARDYKGFGNQSMTGVIEPSIEVLGHYMPSGHEASRVVDADGIAPTVKENHGTVTAIVEPKIIKVGQLDSSFDQSGRVYSAEGIAPTVMSNSHGTTSGGYTSLKILVNEPFIVASRGRNPENPSDRTTGSPTEQRLEANMSGTTNTITTVVKDNYVMEPIIYDDYNSRIPQDQDAITTLTTNCGASAVRNGVKIIEPTVCEQRYDEGLRFFKDDVVGTLRTIDACGDKRVIEPELTQIGTIDGNGHEIRRRVYDADGISPTLCGVGSGGNTEPKVLVKDEDVNPVRIGNIYGEQFGTGYAGNVWDQDSVSPTIMTAQGGNRQPLVVDDVKWRIRKLTPLECWRLMGFSDEDCNRASAYVSDSSLYKQAGNSIVTSCLVAIFYSLLFNDGSTKWSDYIVQYKINGGN